MAKEKKKIKNDGGRYSLKGSCLWGILLFAILVLLDQLTKIAAELYMSSENVEPITIIPGYIRLTLVYNRGISYGLGSNASPTVKMAVIAGTAVVMLALAFCYFKMDKRRSFLRTAFVFVVAGGVGNLVDRVYYRVWESGGAKGVRDMVDLSRFGFAVCNFADFFITGGAVMMVLAMIFFDRDAVYPTGEKYRALAKEYEAEQEEKKQRKAMQQKAEIAEEAQSFTAENEQNNG